MGSWKIKSSEWTEDNPKVYTITDEPWKCECKGFEIRQHCRHVEEAKKKKEEISEENLDNEINNQQTSPDDPETEEFKKAIEDEREKLLDLSNRNKLLNFTFPKNSCLRIIDEIPDILFKKLLDKQELVFDPIPEPKQAELRKYYKNLGEEPPKEKEGNKIKPPKAEEWAKNLGINIKYELPEKTNLNENQRRHQDKKIQTLYYEKDLHRLLTKMNQKSESVMQEKGTNMLYMAFGFLEYFNEREPEKILHSPLILLPAKIQKNFTIKGTQYKLIFSDEDVDRNLSLAEKLRLNYNIKIPDFTLETDKKNEEVKKTDKVNDYFNKISNLLGNKPDWKIKKQMALSFFAFKNVILYNDLDLDKNPSILNHKILKNLLTNVSSDESSTVTSSDEIMDEYNGQPIELHAPLILPADSSQHNSIVKVLNGESLVIKGPPGTGKSQTITNILAAGLKMGKKILFVAEKTAALQVVKKRLDKAGLGQYCLELHTDKVQKTKIADALKNRLENKEKFDVDNYENILQELHSARTNLKKVNNWLHQEGENNQKPFHVIGKYEKTKKKLSENLRRNLENLNFDNPNLELQTLKEIIQKFDETKKKVSKYKPLEKHPWSVVKENQKVFDITKYLKECLRILDRFDSSNKIEIPNLTKCLIFIKENSEQINTYNDKNFFNENLSKLIHDLSKDINEFNKKKKKISEIFKLNLKKAQDIKAIEKALIIKKVEKQTLVTKIFNPKDEFTNLKSFYNKITKETQLINIDVSEAKRDLKQLIK